VILLLNELWKDVKTIVAVATDANKRLAEFYKDETWKPELISMYELERAIAKAKERLVDLAVKRTLEKHNIRNVQVSDEVKKKFLDGEEFDEEEIEKYIRENFVKNADELAYGEILRKAKNLLPLSWERKLKVSDIVKGNKLFLRLWWNYGNISLNSAEEIFALEQLIHVVLGKAKPSKVELSAVNMYRTIDSFRTYHEEFSQARKYTYTNKWIDGFRIYKNGKFEIRFKKESYAKKIAKALIS